MKIDYSKLLPKRKPNGSKYDHGVATLIAGSYNMPGAAILAGLAAMRSGLGLLEIISEDRACNIIATSIPEAIFKRYNEDTTINSKSKVIAFGPGCGNNYQTLFSDLIQSSKLPLIIDADGINFLANNIELLENHQSEILITPHNGEYQRLFGTVTGALQADIKTNAIKYSINILHKGHPTIISNKFGEIFISPYGNSALATAGSGDVLTGLICGIAAQMEPPNLLEAALLAAYIHGKAGEELSKELSEYSVIASDLIKIIPKILKDLGFGKVS